MMRRLFSLAAGVSFVLFLATVALWVRSYWFDDMIAFGRTGGDQHFVRSMLGRIHLHSSLGVGHPGGMRYRGDRLGPAPIWNGGMSGYPPQPRWHFGCLFQTYTHTHVGFGPGIVMRYRLLVLPDWLPAAALAVMPCIALGKTERDRHRRRCGYCRFCGYDLRATPDRCPECGRETQPPATSAGKMPADQSPHD